MSFRLGIFIAFFSLCASAQKPEGTPNFECTDREGTLYKVWISQKARVLQVTDKTGTKEFPLSGANIGRPPKGPGERLAYHRWHRDAIDPLKQLDLSTEFSTHYVMEKGNSVVRVGIVIDHREKTGLTCKTSRAAVGIVPEENTAPAFQRHATHLEDVASIRGREGSLTPGAVLGVEAAIVRMVYSQDFQAPQARKEFVTKVAPHLKKIAPSSISLIGSRLPAAAQGFWKSTLEEIKYNYYPVVERARTWVIEGARPVPLRHLDSVRAGFAQFVRSPGYKEKDIREFFITEVVPSLKELKEADINTVKIGLKPEAKSFLTSLWGKAMGKRTLADFPDIDRLAAQLGSTIAEKQFDPMKVRDTLAAFLTSSMALNAEARQLFIQTAGPVAKRLTPRQKEDVLGWLEENEANLFRELLR